MNHRICVLTSATVRDRLRAQPKSAHAINRIGSRSEKNQPNPSEFGSIRDFLGIVFALESN